MTPRRSSSKVADLLRPQDIQSGISILCLCLTDKSGTMTSGWIAAYASEILILHDVSCAGSRVSAGITLERGRGVDAVFKTRSHHLTTRIYTFRHSVKPRFDAPCFQRGRERVEPAILAQLRVVNKVYFADYLQGPTADAVGSMGCDAQEEHPF